MNTLILRVALLLAVGSVQAQFWTNNTTKTLTLEVYGPPGSATEADYNLGRVWAAWNAPNQVGWASEAPFGAPNLVSGVYEAIGAQGRQYTVDPTWGTYDAYEEGIAPGGVVELSGLPVGSYMWWWDSENNDYLMADGWTDYDDPQNVTLSGNENLDGIYYSHGGTNTWTFNQTGYHQMRWDGSSFSSEEVNGTVYQVGGSEYHDERSAEAGLTIPAETGSPTVLLFQHMQALFGPLVGTVVAAVSVGAGIYLMLVGAVWVMRAIRWGLDKLGVE